MRTTHCWTTEGGSWVSMPFRVRARRLYKRDARRLAVRWRRRGHLARVRPDPQGGWMVATYEPRLRAPRSCDLTGGP